MAKMGVMGGLVMFFVVVVIGMALLSSTSDTISTTTDTYTTTSTESLINGTPVAVVSSGNNVTAFTSVVHGAVTCNVTADWIGDAGATTINLTGTSACGTDSYNVTFSYRSNDFIEDSSTRAMITLIVIFFALAVLFGGMQFIDWKSLGM